jgi:hypothetical protein
MKSYTNKGRITFKNNNLVVYGQIVHGHVSPFVLHLFMASQLVVLEKQIDGIRPIMIGKVTY